MANYEFIKKVETAPQSDGRDEIYPVTQLINSFLTTLLQNWDELEDEWPHLKQDGLQWPSIKTSEPNQQARQCIGKIRDALAHGLLVFEQGQKDEITAMHLWTCPNKDKTVDWDAQISVTDMEQMLKCFVELAKERDLRLSTARKKGMPCIRSS